MSELNKQTSPMVFEPKKINKYVVEFNEEFGINSWAVTKFDLPKFKDFKWQDLHLEFLDPIGPSTTQGLYRLIKNAEKNRITSGIKPIFSYYIKCLDPCGVIVEKWKISAKNYSIDFGYCDYSKGHTELQKIHMIVEPSYCCVIQ